MQIHISENMIMSSLQEHRRTRVSIIDIIIKNNFRIEIR